MREDKQLLLANKAWAAEITEQNPDFFSRQIVGQKPDFLWIGCSDSRVTAETMTMSEPGSMFIHRNVANQVRHDDLNLMSVLDYAVAVLRVRHVIVCGHYGCGGMKAALDGGTSGPVHEWLSEARQVRCDHAHEIDVQGEDEARLNRLIECNVRDQLLSLARTPTVRTAFAQGQQLDLHGWVYDLRSGLLKPLMEIDANTDLDEVAVPDRVLV